MDNQVEIGEIHRVFLVDWICRAAVQLKLMTETLILSVNIVDRFLQRKISRREKLQLIGIASMFIASKYEEDYYPEIRDFIFISSGKYKRDEIIMTEKHILYTINFNLSTPTSIHFLRRFSKAAKSDSRTHTLSKYLIEMCVIEYTMLEYLPSVIAASAIYIARKMCNVSPLWVVS